MAVQLQQEHLLLLEDDKGHKQLPLENSVYSIGRDQNCDIRLFSQFVSRRHATLVRRPLEDGTYYYRIVDGDLKGKRSANGLLINGRKLQELQGYDLQDADEIVFGPKVRAVYYVLKRESVPTAPPDEFDITLISPSMVVESED